VEDVARAAELARVASQRTRRLVTTLRQLDEAAFAAPSRLPGSSRLTIVCHLRYGHHALLRMTHDSLAGRATAYYPEGRSSQRPATLHPGPGEQPTEILDDWQAAAEELDRVWSGLDDAQWATEVVEPAGRADLGTVPLGRLALARIEPGPAGSAVGSTLPPAAPPRRRPRTGPALRTILPRAVTAPELRFYGADRGHGAPGVERVSALVTRSWSSGPAARARASRSLSNVAVRSAQIRGLTIELVQSRRRGRLGSAWCRIAARDSTMSGSRASSGDPKGHGLGLTHPES
jgi:Mycothiol maleylpyruvate isomerase N-terminal domain